MTDLTIEHTPAGGTVLHGTSRGDGSADVLKARPGGAYWKWSRTLGAWYVPQSRDKALHVYAYRIDRTARALRDAGFTVTEELDDTMPDAAEAEQNRRERAGDRADALDAKAQRRRAEADRHRDASDAAVAGIPPGQPILVGHHSERRHRNTLERSHRELGRYVEANRQAERAADRAETARRNATEAESTATIQNRADRLAADIRRDERTQRGVFAGRYGVEQRTPVDPDSGHGRQLADRIADNRQRLAHEQAKLAERGVITRAQVAPGDAVKVHRDGWRRVVRVNAKTVTCEYPEFFAGHTMTRKYAELEDVHKLDAATAENGSRS